MLRSKKVILITNEQTDREKKDRLSDSTTILVQFKMKTFKAKNCSQKMCQNKDIYSLIFTTFSTNLFSY